MNNPIQRNQQLVPNNLQQLFKIKEIAHSLREYGRFMTLKVQTTSKTFCLSVCGTKLWNQLEIKHK